MRLTLRSFSYFIACFAIVTYGNVVPAAGQSQTQLINAVGPYTSSIIATSDGRVSVAEGDVVILDQGDAQGVKVGDHFLIFQDEADFFSRYQGRKIRAARQVIGELMIIETAARTSKGLIIESQFEISTGAFLAAAPPIEASAVERVSDAGRPAQETQAAAPSAPEHYTVVRGDTLWGISGKEVIYNNPFMWPLIYKANQQQIRDPDLIFPQQILAIPRDYSPSDAEEAIKKARARRRWRLHDGL